MAVEAALISKASCSLPEVSRPLIAVVGGDSNKAENAARHFADAGVAGLVSFGIAGGLDPSLQPGDIVLAGSIWSPDGTITPTHAERRKSVAGELSATMKVNQGAIAGSDFAVTSVAAKAKLYERSGAIAVDMESHGVARAARALKLPIIVMRSIADPASRSIPEAALVGIGPNGERRPFAVFGQLIKKPYQFGALIRVARDSNRAFKSLRKAAPIIFLHLAF